MAAEISAQLVRELRERTGVGMMDCKRALQETNGDMEAAVVLLREKGMANAAKRADRATTEGLVGYRLADDRSRGTMVAIGCETDPVAKSDEFQAFGKKVLDLVEAEGIEAPAQLEQERVELSARLGENVAVAGAARFESVVGGRIAAYAHPPANKLGVLIHVRGGEEELARNLAMHISWPRNARSTSTPTRCGRSPSRRVRRSSPGCSTSASSPSEAGCSPTSRGS